MLGSVVQDPRKFDEFGDINCEDEYARLDNFAVALQEMPNARGIIVFYGGKVFRGKLPRRGDAVARAARMKPYLVERRGLSASRVVVINGGYAENWRVDLWVLPQGSSTEYMAHPTIPANKIKFRKGTARARDFRCEI
ncbi:MAG TPA: hypothetical protein VFX97_19050 [Pyrinomonadaceae bacterium]|nr:hypothetical protein [Pyrinomonadaceae bacterium]